MDKVRTAFIGVGYRGKQLFRLLQNIPFFQVQAVADPGVKSSEISGIPCYNQGEDACLDMLKEHHPELVFIASPWQYHVQHALLCVEHGCHVALEIKGGLYIDEYTPLMVKQSLTGNGRADKKQIQFMVKAMLKLKTEPKPDDAADALAVAICHANTCGFNQRVLN